jgi:hypothetical protein
MASLQPVWVKREGEGDYQALKVHIGQGADVSDLQDTLYHSKKFALVPGSIDCILVRGEDGIAKVASCFCLR